MSSIVKYQYISLNNETVDIKLHYEKFPFQKTVIGILGLAAIGCLLFAGLALMRHPLGSFITNHTAFIMLGCGVGAGILSTAFAINIIKRALYLKRMIDRSWDGNSLEAAIKEAIGDSRRISNRNNTRFTEMYTIEENDIEFKAVLVPGKTLQHDRGTIHFFIKDSVSLYRYAFFGNTISLKED